MTMETRDKAIHQLKSLVQKGMPVEDYVIKFKSLAPLTEFNDYALVSQFRQGLNPNLGFDIVRATAPADDDLEAWYARSVEWLEHTEMPKNIMEIQQKKGASC